MRSPWNYADAVRLNITPAKYTMTEYLENPTLYIGILACFPIAAKVVSRDQVTLPI